jgi:hypothetical protein
LEFEIDEVRFDEVEGAFEIERQSVVDLYCTYFKNWNRFSGRSARSLLDVGEHGETRQKWKPILERGVVYMTSKIFK